ncbi:hypothetical protein [Cupriavidus nantongensis]|uniref:hypothetical protein n=1 Tax=Cupriavidus nantongensis TaxID=1796606 RepID=UPI00358F7DBB
MENWHLYLAAPNATDKFKVGLALHPRDRWDALGLRDLDEEVSIVLAGKRSDVVRAEKALHFFLTPWHAPLEHRQDGFSEWFSRECVDTARAHFLALLDHGERFSRVDFATLTRSSPSDAVVKPTSEERRRRKFVRIADAVSQACSGVRQRLPEFLSHFMPLLTQADGVARHDNDYVALCYQNLSRIDYAKLRSLANTAFEVDLGLIGPHFGSRFLSSVSGRFENDHENSGQISISINLDAPAWFIDRILALSHIPGIDWDGIAACEHDLSEFMDKCTAIWDVMPKVSEAPA